MNKKTYTPTFQEPEYLNAMQAQPSEMLRRNTALISITELVNTYFPEEIRVLSTPSITPIMERMIYNRLSTDTEVSFYPVEYFDPILDVSLSMPDGSIRLPKDIFEIKDMETFNVLISDTCEGVSNTDTLIDQAVRFMYKRNDPIYFGLEISRRSCQAYAPMAETIIRTVAEEIKTVKLYSALSYSAGRGGKHPSMVGYLAWSNRDISPSVIYAGTNQSKERMIAAQAIPQGWYDLDTELRAVKKPTVTHVEMPGWHRKAS